MFVYFSLVFKSHTFAFIGTVLYTSRCCIAPLQLQLFIRSSWVFTTALTHNSLSWQFFASVFIGKSVNLKLSVSVVIPRNLSASAIRLSARVLYLHWFLRNLPVSGEIVFTALRNPNLPRKFHKLSESILSEFRCIGCQLCSFWCPVDCLNIAKSLSFRFRQQSWAIDRRRCIFCGNCAGICPVVAINFCVKSQKLGRFLSDTSQVLERYFVDFNCQSTCLTPEKLEVGLCYSKTCDFWNSQFHFD